MDIPNYQAAVLSPILSAENLATTALFYREVLGFEAVLTSEHYVILRKGPASIHLTQAAEGVLESTRGHFSIYLEVDEIEPLWAHVSNFKGQYKTRDLFDREYGMREFHIIDPDRCLIFVGMQMTGTSEDGGKS